MTKIALLTCLLCASPQAELTSAKEAYLTAVLQAQEAFLKAIDEKLPQVLEKDFDEALRLRKLRREILLGLFSGTDSAAIYSEQHNYLEAIESATVALNTAYEQAIKEAGTDGGLDLALKIRKEQEHFVEGTYEPSVADGRNPEVLLGRYLGEPQQFGPLDDPRIPDELTVTCRRRYAVISGTATHNTIRVNGKSFGWFGKAVQFTNRKPRSGFLRATVPTRIGHTAYVVAFLRDDVAVDRVGLPLEADVVYEWSLKPIRGGLEFSLMRDGKVELEQRFSGRGNLAFVTYVRYPRDRAELRVSF